MLTYSDGLWYVNYNFRRDLGLRRARAAIEVLEARSHVLFHWDDHYERLINSCEGEPGIILEHLPSKEKIESTIKFLLQTAARESLVWIFATPGESRDLKTPLGFPALSVDVVDLPAMAIKPFKLKTINAKRAFPKFKLTAGYGFAALYEAEAKNEGFDKFLYWDDCLGVLEGAYENIFFVSREGELFAPNAGILYGITRKIILELARSKGLFKKIAERPVHLWQLDYCDEAFLTSTTLGVAEVVSVDSHKFKTSPDNVYTQKLKKLFCDYCEDYYKSRGA